MINKTLRHTPKVRTERSKIFLANFLSGLSMYQTQKPEQDDRSRYPRNPERACAIHSI